ncbi:hypothetical protein ACW4FP_20340 (plasmid) [Paenarthrobacter ureafaciens]
MDSIHQNHSLPNRGIGALYSTSLTGLIIFTIGTQLVALIAFIPLLKSVPAPTQGPAA